jgi:LDH2 family malate/lactate/ureidoglycolate dehydrogenase/glyoxylase-like metal-dependent hydrolase (beta-lactamase superfamily II)
VTGVASRTQRDAVSQRRRPAADLRRHAATLVRAMGARPGDAERVAAALVDADLCGHRSHGVRQLPYYAGQVQRGEIDVTSEIETVLDGAALAILDGHLGFGHVIAAEVTERVASRAREQRVAAVAVRNANHIGRLGEYTETLAARGMAGILLVTAQGADQQIAPFGAIDRRLTNNPLSLAVPGPDYPIVLDMALSEAAESRVLHAADLGAEIPSGWVLDSAGRPSTDPQDYLRGGSLLPVGAAAGSHKGYSLIVLTELIVGLLAAVPLSGPASPPFSNAFVLIAVDLAGAAAERQAEVADLTGWIKSARLRGAGEILIPGELEARRRREAADSVALDPVTVAQLDELASELGVAERLADPEGPGRGVSVARDRDRDPGPDPAGGTPRATATRVLVFHCGGDWSPLGIYDPLDPDGAQLVYGPYLLFVIEHPRGRVLFDTGMHPKWKTLGRARRIEVGDGDDAVSLLAGAGVAPGEVDHVVASHLHYDHAGGLQFFAGPPVWVQAAELRFARAPAVYQRELYDPDDFDHPLRWQELDGAHDLFGDGAVTIMPTPGHTPGHQSLCVELPSGLHVLAADASYTGRAMRCRHLPGVVWNPDAMVASWEALEELERDRGARLIFTHDLDFQTAKPLAPDAWYE